MLKRPLSQYSTKSSIFGLEMLHSSGLEMVQFNTVNLEVLRKLLGDTNGKKVPCIARAQIQVHTHTQGPLSSLLCCQNKLHFLKITI